MKYNDIINQPLTRKPHTLDFLGLTVSYEGFLKATQAIHDCRKTAFPNDKGVIEPEGMCLIGLSGAGKSTVVKEYVKNFPPKQNEQETYIPVIYVSLDQKCTVIDIQKLLLNKLCPFTTGEIKEKDLMRRIEILLKAARTELIIIDEIQHVLPEHTSAKTQHAADYIKCLLDKSNIPIVLVGLPDSIRLLHAKFKSTSKEEEEDQLFRRLGSTVRLEPYEITSPEWKRLLKGYQKSVRVPCINLDTKEMLTRFHLATKGLHGRITRILRKALELTDGVEQITLHHLARGYEQAFPTYSLDFNPFRLTSSQLKRYIPK